MNGGLCDLRQEGLGVALRVTVVTEDDALPAAEEAVRMSAVITAYMLGQMEPTDRAVRPYGSAYPADGWRPERRGRGAMPGTEPFRDKVG